MNRALQTALMVLLLSCVGCDQATKILAKSHLSTRSPLEYLDGAVRIQYAENAGAFLSLGAELPEKARFLLFVGLVCPLLLAGLAFAFRSESMILAQKLGMIVAVGGGIGNVIDRIAHGAVVDFVSLGIGPLRTGIFNLADVAITAGLLLFLAAGARASESANPVAESPNAVEYN